MYRRTGKIILAAVAVKSADSKSSKENTAVEETTPYKCRPSDLPLYAPIYVEKSKPHPKDVSQVRRTIENGISAVRVQAFKAINLISSKKKSIENFVDTGKAHSKFIFDYLNERDNSLPRAGAIAIGGLSGFILALRRGFIRRIVYASVGSGAIASVCYPKEAEKIAQDFLAEAKKNASIAYNFAVGVKPGDDVNAANLPKFPTNMSEITDSFSDLIKSVKDALFSSKNK